MYRPRPARGRRGKGDKCTTRPEPSPAVETYRGFEGIRNFVAVRWLSGRPITVFLWETADSERKGNCGASMISKLCPINDVTLYAYMFCNFCYSK
jgi:hypothetical protein